MGYLRYIFVFIYLVRDARQKMKRAADEPFYHTYKILPFVPCLTLESFTLRSSNKTKKASLTVIVDQLSGERYTIRSLFCIFFAKTQSPLRSAQKSGLLFCRLPLARGISVFFVCYCSTASAISFFLAQSGQRMSSPSVMNPFPTMETRQEEQTKHSLCQWRPSNAMKRVPPIPDGTVSFG